MTLSASTMLHRSFWTGLAAISLAFFCVYLGTRLIAPHLFVSASSAHIFPEPPSMFEVAQFMTTSIERNSLNEYVLQEPPLDYLQRVKAEPSFSPEDVVTSLPVLMYHHIRPIKRSFTVKDRLYSMTPEAFEAQMLSLVKAGYRTISPRDLEAAIEGRIILPEKVVLLTFDDGYREHATSVLPILKKLHLQATYFIISRSDTSPAHMTKAMIREADATGLITLAAHTRHHVFLSRLSSSERMTEIEGSKKDLEAIVDHPLYDFAYPFGSWSQAVADDVKKAGFALGFGVRLGSIHTSSSRYQLRRIRVLHDENIVSLLDAFSKP